jgi:antitoxin component YwqK of YwqJK toxin-antitoxin module
MNYLFGLLHDEVRTYYDNGTIKSIERYYRGLRNGKSAYYDRSGQMTIQYDYENDRAVRFLTLDSVGNVLASGGNSTGNFVVERKNRSGQLLESCRFVNGKKEGEHKLFYSNGILAELTRYEKGLPLGKSLQFYPSGTIQRQISFEYGNLSIITEETNYYPNGKVSSQYFNLADGGYRICHYSTQGCRVSDQYFNSQGLAVGLQRFYRPDGKPFYELQYDEKGALINAVTYSIDELRTDTVRFDAQGNGKLVVYYSDKKPALEGAFKSGVQEGDWILLDRNSELLVSNQYLNGFLHGAHYVYYPSGNICLEGQYRLGKPELLWREFYQNGQVAVSGKYKAGIKDGKWLYFREDGSKDIEEHWQNGIQEGPTKWFAPDGSVQIILFYKAGIISKYGWLQRNGRLTRQQVTTEKLMSYFKNGSIAVELTQSNGSLHGLARRFYPNSMLSEVDSFSFGYRHGRQIRYSLDKLPTVIKNYYYGRLHGVYQLYDANGKIIREEEYCYGTLIGDQDPLTDRQVINKKIAPK